MVYGCAPVPLDPDLGDIEIHLGLTLASAVLLPKSRPSIRDFTSLEAVDRALLALGLRVLHPTVDLRFGCRRCGLPSCGLVLSLAFRGR